MLMRSDPFRELDRLTENLFGRWSAWPPVPMDAYRRGNEFYVHFDLPGVDPDSIDVTVDRDVLTVRAERPGLDTEGSEVLVSERPTGSFTRELFLGDALDTEHVEADYKDGVLTLRVPVHEAAQPRKVAIASGSRPKELHAA